MEIDINNTGRRLAGIAWRLKNVIVDEVRELPEKGYYEDLLEKIIKELKDDADELDSIGNILTNCTDDK